MLKPEPSELQFTIQQPSSCGEFARRRETEDEIFAGGKLRATLNKVCQAGRTGCEAEERPLSRLGFVTRGIAEMSRKCEMQRFLVVYACTELHFQRNAVISGLPIPPANREGSCP